MPNGDLNKDIQRTYDLYIFEGGCRRTSSRYREVVGKLRGKGGNFGFLQFCSWCFCVVSVALSFFAVVSTTTNFNQKRITAPTAP